ncbi:MAG: ABC transporter ATP-binding protein [Chloroflexi bacterium]|nr:ABC transporter ATP-binding protein [Chloroflexota bacterium]
MIAHSLTPLAHVPVHEGELAVDAWGVRHVYRARAGTVAALDGIRLGVRRGDLLAILGPSGCGKSTLLRILAGLIVPTAGTIRLAGEAPEAARSGAGIGWLAQDDGLLPWRTVVGNVRLPLQLGARPRGPENRAGEQAGGLADHAAVMAALGAVGLAESANRYPHELSGGMRQRAALARALVARPAFLFLDEPFANLDELTRERLGDLLLDVRASERPTTLLVTHSVVEAVRLADRVLVLSGRPAVVLEDTVIPLARPRRFDQAGFGELAQQLRALLGAPALEAAP